MIRGRIAFVFLLVCNLATFGSLSAQPKAASRIGWISDESCGAQHTKPGRADLHAEMLARRCVGGSPGMEIATGRTVADDDQAIWIVENPDAIKNVPAAHVVLEGKFNSAEKTIHVEKITPAAT